MYLLNEALQTMNNCFYPKCPHEAFELLKDSLSRREEAGHRISILCEEQKNYRSKNYI